MKVTHKALTADYVYNIIIHIEVCICMVLYSYYNNNYVYTCTYIDPLPPPEIIHVASIDTEDVGVQTMFNWTPMWQSCRAVQYAITSMNCGVCPTLINATQASCRDVAVGSICSFAVHTVTCGTIVEAPINSTSLTVTLKGITAIIYIVI